MTRRDLEANPPGPWSLVPPDVGAALRAALPEASSRVIDTIRAEIPAFDQPLRGEFGRVVRSGVNEAMERFIEVIERQEPDALGPQRTLYYDLGRRQFQEGRTVDHLLSAYRVGARVALQEIVGACERNGVEPHFVYQLADRVMAYVNELSSASTEGYAAERAAAADVTQAARQELVELLTSRQAQTPASLQAAAERARYRLPARIAALACRGAEAAELAARIEPDALGARLDGLACILIPEPERLDDRRLEASLENASAALGPTVPPEQARRSWELARRAVGLMQRGAIDQHGVVRAEEQLVTMLLNEEGAQVLVDALEARWLARLETQRGRYVSGVFETLLAWFQRHGDVKQTAADLAVHPNTVRYRLEKARELYGEALDDADASFELQLALRAVAGRRKR